MFATGDVVYVSLPDATEADPLCLARVTEKTGTKVVIDFRDRVEAPAGAAIGLFAYDHSNRFVRMGARVDRVEAGDIESQFELTITEDAAVANKRHCFRIRIIDTTDRLTISGEKRFRLNDVSIEGNGFSVAGPDVFVPGQLVEVTLEHGRGKAEGNAWVRNSGKGPGGRHRFGIEPAEDANALRALLREIAADVVRRKQRNAAAKRA